jgi:rRNA-processing protein FCF1
MPYEIVKFSKATISTDYHILVDNNYYSVPYQLIGKKIEIRHTGKTIEAFLKGQRVLFELEENLLEERQKNNQANIKLENERANVSELTKQVKILEKNHEMTLKQKTEELLISKDQKVLEV